MTKQYGKWLTTEEHGYPPCGEVVIVEYSGHWPHLSGSGGIVDRYAWDGEWYNVPEKVKITKWMWIPEEIAE